MSLTLDAKRFSDPEKLAAAVIKEYYRDSTINYPINPFLMLKDEGILFSIRAFNKLEGLYIPAKNSDDIPVVAINGKRPITRQRYTAAHELCHHLRDSDCSIACNIGEKNNPIETFAERFAAGLLMPINELKKQVDKYKDKSGEIGFDSILDIADYFGVSFESCAFRIAYKLHAVQGDVEAETLKRRIKKYAPDKQRKDKKKTYVRLYEELIEGYKNQFAFIPSDKAKNLFQNIYIYYDSRLEGLDVDQDRAAEIVTDLRLNTQHSEYCNEKDEAYMSIAGHYDMYELIFSEAGKTSISVFDIFKLNKCLFTYYPHPEYGGATRNQDTLVLGAKFEAVEYTKIFPELSNLDQRIQECFAEKDTVSMCEYVRQVSETHHRLTVIHPFKDGNGRSSRAFMNIQFLRAGLPPVYILPKEKQTYLDALTEADNGNYDFLYEVIYKALFNSHMNLNS